MTKRSASSILLNLGLALTIVCLSRVCSAADADNPFFWHNGVKQNLNISTARIVITLPENYNPAIVESITQSDPRITKVWIPKTQNDQNTLICELISGIERTELNQLIESLEIQNEITKVDFSYSNNNESLIPTNRLLIQFVKTITSAEISEINQNFDLIVHTKLDWLENGFILTQKNQDQNSLELANQLMTIPGVLFCHPNFIRLFKPTAASPNDTHFIDQWGFSNDGTTGTIGADINMIEAWRHARGRSTVSIAIIDEGVDTTHEDLSSKIVNQYDATDQDNNQQPKSWDGHGTACAGVAAAIPNNSVGIAGVAWNCSIMPVRMAYKETPLPVLWVTSDEIVADAIITAAIRGADVLSLSWGLTYSSEIIYSAIKFAKREGRNGRGCVIVGSSGNSDVNTILFPGAYPETITVGATNEWDQRKSKTTPDGETNWGSNYGPELDVVAPGVHIWTTDMMGSSGYNTINPLFGDSTGNYWSKFTGTSSAVPVVAGLAALIISLDTNLTSDSVQIIIQSSADDMVGLISEDTPGWDQYMGYGRINAYNAVKDMSDILYVGDTLFENITWDTNKVYVITNDLIIPAGVTLTINAGVVVKFDYLPPMFGIHQKTKMIIEGTLEAQSTLENPIVFTSIRDDQYGGDTNGDASESSPMPGDWGYLKITGANNSLENAVIRYAGAGWFEQSDISPFPINYYDKFSLWINNQATGINISDCTIEHSVVSGGEEPENSTAIYWSADSLSPGHISITNNTITNAQDAIHINGHNTSSTANISGNLFNNIAGLAVQCESFTDSVKIISNSINSGTTGILCTACSVDLVIDSNQITNQSLSAINLASCRGIITNNILEQINSFVGSGTGLKITQGSNLLIQLNNITNFDYGLWSESGPANDLCDLTVSLNSIVNNLTSGIYLASTEISSVDGPIAVINYNDLINYGYNLYLGEYQNPDQKVINATDNWWGTGDSSAVALSIYEHDDDLTSPAANYLLFKPHSVFTTESEIEINQSKFDISLFPDSAITEELIIYNSSIDYALNYNIQEGVSGGSDNNLKSILSETSLADIEWLAIQPTFGVILPGDSAIIQISINAENLIDADYQAFLVIENNDPDNNPLVIPVNLEVSSIFVLIPNGGELFDAGVTQSIAWQMTNTQIIDSMKIWLSTDNGQTFSHLIMDIISDTSQFEWLVPNLMTDSALIKTEIFWAGDIMSEDESDSLFSIILGEYFCGKYVNGYTGNTNCSLDGFRDLADITQLIDRVYLSKEPLCNETEGNTNGDSEALMNLADITRLIDNVYLSKAETEPCE